MAKAKVPIDQYPNRALVSVTQAVADDLTFEQINFGVGTFQGVALVLHRIDFYFPQSTLDNMTAQTDELQAALTTRDSLSELTPVSQDVISFIELTLGQSFAAGLETYVQPFQHDFSDLPGGGLIMPANPLYLAVDSDGFATAATAYATMYYTFKELSDKDYIELIQTLIPGNF